MELLDCAFHQRMSRRCHDESGFALMAVLAVMALTALTLVALLGMMLTTMGVSEGQSRGSAELRAADGAVTAALNQLRLTPSTGDDPCAPTIPASGLDLDFDNGSNGANGTPALTSDDMQIGVTCTEYVPEVPPSDPGGEVKITGTSSGTDDYQGSVKWSTNCADGQSEDCFPWQSALGSSYSSGAVSALKPTLMHSGPDSLDFNANVIVAGGAAVLRNPAHGADSSPALKVGGSYTQGRPGPLGGSGSCGILAGDDLNPAAKIASPQPVACDSADARNVIAEAPSYRINPTERSAPACSAAPVIVLRPGRYDRDAVADLNALFDGSCPDKTFLFVRSTPDESGSFWFDADNPDGPADLRHTLTIDDPTSSFVFGTPKGWSVSSGAPEPVFPRACDTDAPGSSIVLSGRTELRHLAGRVSICPDMNDAGTPLAAVLQEPLVPHQVQVTATSGDFSPAADLVSGTADQVATKKLSCKVTLANSICKSQAAFTVATFTPGDALMTSARIGIRGGEHNPVTAIQSRRVSFTVTPSAASGYAACTTPQLEGFPNNNQTASYELLTGDCSSLDNESALDGASITAQVEYRFKGICFFLNCPTMSETLRIFDVTLDTAVTYATATPANVSADPADWNGPASAAVDDSDAAEMSVDECLPIFGDGICDYLPPSIRPDKGRELTFSDLTVGAEGGLTDESAVDELSVLVRYIRDGDIPSSGAGTNLTFTLHTDAGDCTAAFSGIANFTHDVSFDLFGQSGECGGLVQTVGQLQHSSLTMVVEPECTVDYQFGAWRCLGAIQPKVQHVALMVGSSSYRGMAPTSQVSIDADSGTSFNVYGATYLRGSSLDMHWKGSVTRDPVFGGQLVVNALASDMSSEAVAGLVCCNGRSDERNVTLLAKRIDGSNSRTLLSVSATLDKNGTITILDWKICSREACT